MASENQNKDQLKKIDKQEKKADKEQKSKDEIVKEVSKFEKHWLSFFIIKKRLTYLIIFFLFIVGLLLVNTIPKETNPEVEVPYGVVVTTYPGASPIDVEQQVTKEIEDKINDLEGVKEVESSSGFGFSSVTVEFEAEEDVDDSIRKLKDKVDEVKPDLPDDATDPNVIELNVADEPVLTFSVRGPNYDVSELKEFSEDLRDELKSIRNVNEARVIGGEEKEIKVIIDPNKLSQIGFNSNDILNVLNSSNINIPAGTIEIDEYEFSVRVQNEFEQVYEIENLIVGTRDGSVIEIKDIAEVKEGFKETQSISRISVKGDPAEQSVSIQIFKKTGGDVTRVAQEARQIVEEAKGEIYPEDVQVIVTRDTAKYAEESINTLVSNGFMTVVIILILLILFVGFKEALITSLAVPLIFFSSGLRVVSRLRHGHRRRDASPDSKV
jgi:multidrug efflux pump subunit AcrB